MATVEEQIEQIQEEIRKTPHHKGTDHHIGRMRAKISRLKDRLFDSQSKKSGGGTGGYAVRKQGDATVVLVGPPSAGKSTLVNALTNAESRVAPYSFTTVRVIPGMMKFRNAYIQILDVPGLIEGAEEGKGRGREVLSVVRGADLLVLISDVKRPEAIPRIETALEKNGIRINKQPPNITINSGINGGLVVKSNIKQDFSDETIKEIAREMGMKNGEIQIRQKITIEELIDSFSKNRVYVPSIKVLNKAEEQIEKDRHASLAMTKAVIARSVNTTKQSNTVFISAEFNKGLDILREKIWEALNLTRIYLVRRDEEPNEKNPLIVKQGVTLKEVALKIGPDFAVGKKHAKIWGNGAKFEGQIVSLRTQVREGMKIRFI